MILAPLLGAWMLGALAGDTAVAAPSRIPRCSELAPHAVHQQPVERVGLFRNTARLFLWLYQKGVSPGDGDRCGMYPSCSAYTWQAVQRDGPVLGGFLGGARILSNHRDLDRPLCLAGTRLLRVDLPQEEEFWHASR